MNAGRILGRWTAKPHRNKLVEVTELGDLGYLTLNNAFSFCENLLLFEAV